MSYVEGRIKEIERIANLLQHVPAESRRKIVKGLLQSMTNNSKHNQAYWLHQYAHTMSDFVVSCLEDLCYTK